MSQRLTTKQFVSKARTIHGSVYSYDHTEYVSYSTKVIISCNLHGKFEQSPLLHLRGAGCRKCSYEKRANDKRKPIDRVLQEFASIHGNLYDYSKVNYSNTDTVVVVGCKEHGEYDITPYNHIHEKRGCPKCLTNKRGALLRKPLDQFINEASIKHNNKFDYSKVVYSNCSEKVIISCPIHGDFIQQAQSHLQGAGCKLCGIKQRSVAQTLEVSTVIQRSNNIHDNKYNYDNVVYLNNTTKVTIDCPSHGKFIQTPASHLYGAGCPQCGVEQRASNRSKSTLQFIDESVKLHGQTYDYSTVNYINTNTNVIICCNIHGEFTQSPQSHLRGNGCPACAHENMKYTNTSFIQQAALIHDNVYTYDNVDYVGIMSKVTITCPTHGNFDQIGNVHLNGGGCKECASAKFRKPTEQFIVDSKKIHQDKYSYESVTYINNYSNVIITCPTHGDFNQTPSTHLNGSGCKRCSQLGRYDYNRLTTDPDLIDAPGCCYLIKLSNNDEKFYKVGITVNAQNRMRMFPYKTEKIAHINSTLLNAFILEQNILKVHADNMYSPSEIFGGHTECLTLSSDEVDNIIELFNSITPDIAITPLFDIS